uniref:Dopamine receptor 2-like n=1 Tax=Saccoglossus kowalevskii TaxID=10224 RepID=A0ABM0GTT2_SACKO|nr:PREDICTED: dopamine receptor 2-like [Saccoglossus kowalevskii]
MDKYRVWNHSQAGGFLDDDLSGSGFIPEDEKDNIVSTETTTMVTDWLVSTTAESITHRVVIKLPSYEIPDIVNHINTTLNISIWLSDNLTYTNKSIFEDRDLIGSFSIQQPLLAIVLTLFAIVIVFGNSLVILAVYRERYLRTTTNCFIVSLAFSDLLIGLVVVPFAMINDTSGGYWVFGTLWCDLWHAIDVLASTASIMNLCVISLDRYWAVTYPMSYPTAMTKRVASILISLVWLVSSSISFPCILWWKAVDPPAPPNTCLFTEDVKYLIISSCVSFYIPTVIMIFTYYKIYRAATTQLRHIRHGTKRVNASPGARKVNGEVELRIHRGGAAHAAYGKKKGGRGLRRDGKGFVALTGRRMLSRISKEHKAAKMLGIVMGVFELCWLPFFITNNILWAVCKTDCVQYPHIVIPITAWLGYINSAFNPMIYARSSRGFKRAFKRILCKCVPKLKYRRKDAVSNTLDLYSVDSYVPETSCMAAIIDDDNLTTTGMCTEMLPNKYPLPHQYF